MFTNNKLAKSVRLAIAFGAAATALPATQAFAQEEGAEDIEKISVTGSRIKRTDLEGASPVNIITSADMKVEGNFTVADALRGSTFNSFGSFSERSGSSAQSQATLDLRGAGSQRTLVLLDGKRLPGSPTLGGQSANLNAIPMAAVERIEILTDGASSTYGSDAIAGVVNIILKENYEGLTVNIGKGWRTRDTDAFTGDSTSDEFSVIAGVSNDKGNITFSFDHQKRDGISDGAREFTAAKMTDFDGDGEIQAYNETDGWSIYGATVAAPDFSSALASPDCDSLIAEYGENTFRKVAADSDWSDGSDYCMYAYANVSYNKASIDRNTVFVDANYEVADGVEFFARAMFVQNKSFGRYAPPAAPWRNMSYENSQNPYGVSGDGAGFADPNNPALAWSPQFTDNDGNLQYYSYDADGETLDSTTQRVDSDGNPVVDSDGNPVYVPLAGAYDPDMAYKTTTGYYRWVGIGTRDGNVYDYNQDYLMGFRGFSEIAGLELDWEVYYHRNIADNKSVGQYYLSYGGLAENIANGIDLGSETGIANMKATTLQESSSTFDQFYAGAGFDAFELPGGTAAHYFGLERMEIDYADIYDAQSEAGLIGGSAGNSSSGYRDITALFYEAALPVTDDIELNIAARYDDYSDFGDNLAPKVAVRWQLLDSLVLRASYSEAFRAPGLDEMNAATTFSAEAAIDYPTGATTSSQFDTYYKSNPNLGAETSEYTNLGLAYDITDDVSVKVDYFNLAIDNVIATKTVQSLISDQQAGLLTPVGTNVDVSGMTFYLQRAGGAPDGVLIQAGTGYDNQVGFEISGMDVTVNASLETAFGDFRFNAVNSFVLSYDQELGGELVNTAGWSGQPDHRANVTVGWSLDNHSVTFNSNYIAETSENETYNSTSKAWEQDGTLDSWLIHNVTYTYNAGDYGLVSLSVANLTDEDPILNSLGQYNNADLYNNFGQDVRVSYTVSF